MIAPLVERRTMAKAGRPKGDSPPPETKMVRITKETNEAAREVCGAFGESISAYIVRVVLERAASDRAILAKRYAREAEAKKKERGGES